MGYVLVDMGIVAIGGSNGSRPQLSDVAVGSGREEARGGAIVGEDVELGVRGALNATTIEVMASPRIPEVVEVERRAEHRGSVARLHPSEALVYPNRVR